MRETGYHRDDRPLWVGKDPEAADMWNVGWRDNDLATSCHDFGPELKPADSSVL